MNGAPHPVRDRLAAIAVALGDLANDVVFIGGAVAPLLQQSAPFAQARPTSDVDGLIAAASYRDVQRIHRALTQRGFRQAPGGPRHIYRWTAPSDIPFDLVPVGTQLGASGGQWDRVTLATAAELRLRRGLVIRHASAPAFLALKWSAYHDRGRDDPQGSHDLEDILALLASRPSVAAEAAQAPTRLRTYLAAQARGVLDDPYLEDLLAGHLNNAQDPRHTVAVVRERLAAIAGLRRPPRHRG